MMTQWLPLETAPKDGALLRLLVAFTEHPMDDDTGPPQATIGMNNLGNTGVDEWQFCGWNWTRDCFTQGEGTVVGWLPLLGEIPSSSVEDHSVLAAARRLAARGWFAPSACADQETAADMRAMRHALYRAARSVAREKPADVLLRVIQRLNGNPYSLTKSECISEVEAMYQQALATPEGQQ